MIESVQARQRGAFQFEAHYDDLCALQDTAPLPAVKAHLAQGVIDLNGDRIRLNDWMPIINSIKINKSLQFIAVRSFYKVPTEEDEKRAAILRRKLPSIRSKEITHRLLKALKECLFVSPSLSCIELQGLALRERDLQVLVKGISKSQTLRHLSLEFCRIGDQGLDVLCKGLKNSKFINSVNLSGCSLSHRGAEYLAAVIKHQGMQRHNEAWRDSLRYRRPDLDRMSGLRRITCNNNPLIGDEGSRSLAEALKDDLWLKAMDLQACGISRMGAQCFLEVLKYNTTLVVLDLRRNPLIDRDVMHALMEQLMLNTNGEDTEYKWIKTEEPMDLQAKQTARTRRRATKVLNASLAKKTTIKVTPTSSRRRVKRSDGGQGHKVETSPGLPWRTAARAHRYRGHPPELSRFVKNPAGREEFTTSDLFTSKNTNNHHHLGGACDLVDLEDEDEDEDDLDEDPSSRADVVVTTATTLNKEHQGGLSRMVKIQREAEEAMRELEESHMSMDLSNHKEVLIELEQMRRHLREERLARAKADQRVVHLMLENRRLREEVSRGARTGGRLEDEGFLESVEAAFKQFHSFIDMLKEAGLGQLVTMAGLDQSQMPFATTTTTAPTATTNNYSYYNSDPSAHQANTTYANMPLASSAFVSDLNHRQRPVGRSQLAGVSMTASFSEESPLVFGGSGNDGDAAQENDSARREADEVYSRLVEQTRGTLDNQGEATSARTSAINVAAAIDAEAARKAEARSAESRSQESRSQETRSADPRTTTSGVVLGPVEDVEEIGTQREEEPTYENHRMVGSTGGVGGVGTADSFLSDQGEVTALTPRWGVDESRDADDDDNDDDDEEEDDF